MKKESFIKVNEKWLKLSTIKEIKVGYGELLLLSKIDTLSQSMNCIARDSYFAELLYQSERTVKRYIVNLKDANIITTTINKKGLSATERTIKINYNILNQYLGSDNIDTTSTVGSDNLGNSKGQIVQEVVTNLVKGSDKSCNEISKKTNKNIVKSATKREEKRIKENRIDCIADAPIPIQSIPSNEVSLEEKQFTDEQIRLVISLFKDGNNYKTISEKTNIKDFDDINSIISDYKSNKTIPGEDSSTNNKFVTYDIPLADGSGYFTNMTTKDFEELNTDIDCYSYDEALSLSNNLNLDTDFVVSWFESVRAKLNK